MPILHWLNDEEARKTSSRVPYRLLEADDVHSYGDPNVENMLIQGDNLEALKALLPYYAGQVKCIYIDPPYNTRSAFEHYDDNLEHSIWLSTMYPRLEMLRDLLADDGSIWVSIDDNEGHYLKVVMDEVFGRNNFVANVIWKKRYAPSNDALWLSDNHDHILLYAKSKIVWRPYKLPRTEEQNKLYSNPDNDPRGLWMSDNYTSAKSAEERPNLYYPITNPNTGEVILPKRSRVWAFNQETHLRHIQENLIYWGKDGKNSTPRLKKFITNLRKDGRVSETIWEYEEVGHTQEARREILALEPDNPFTTPKPERLLSRVLQLATRENDIVLDSFLGSGTTAAVAHKMGRRYIGIEMGEHAITHCVPRLKKVVDGEQGGISKDVNWLGGGGFHFYRLGEAIFDEEGKINPAVKFRALAAHVWFTETHTPLPHVIASAGRVGGARSPYRDQAKQSPLLGIHNGIAYYLLYNGILGEKSKDGGNVLTGKILASLPPHHGQKVIYGELTTFSPQRLARENILFKQVPYDIKAR